MLDLPDAATPGVPARDEVVDPTPALRIRPRLNVPSRWLFRLIDPAGPAADAAEARLDQVDTEQTVNPVAGFLLPDHIDEALEVFDVVGTPLGQLLHEPFGGGVVWEPAPGRPVPADAGPLEGLTPSEEIVGHLAAGVVAADAAQRQGRSAQPEDESALSALLRAVDTTLWTVDSYAGLGNEHIVGLVGRPIAVVRARLSLDVKSDIDDLDLSDPTKLATREQAYRDLAALEIPVRLGELTRMDDGLMGFFVDDDYRTFHIVDKVVASHAFDSGRGKGQLGTYGTTPATPDEVPISHPYVLADDELRVHPGQVVTLTLLMHPAGRVHLSSGILPRKALQLQRDWVAPGLAVMAPSARVGPVLVDPAKVSLPLISAFPKDQLFTRRDTPDHLEGRPDPRGHPDGAAARPAPRGAGGLHPGGTRSRTPGWSVMATKKAATKKAVTKKAVAKKAPAKRAAAKQTVARKAPARKRAVMRAAPPVGPNRLRDLWLPLGPSTVLGGQMDGTAHTTGRVREVKVSPDGTRVYAATANGGVWYSSDQGSTWMALGGWAVSPNVEGLDFYANTLVCGTIAVDWDTTANGENDTVYVGTGEITPRRQGYPGGNCGGVGILRAQGPVGATRLDPFAQVWQREGDGIAGSGVYRLTFNPKDKTQLAAATSDGLWIRTVPAGNPTWTKVTAVPFDVGRVVSDALWAPPVGAPTDPAKLWVATFGGTVWVSDTGTSGFLEITLSDRVDGRMGLAASTDGSIIYAIGKGPRLWRITGTTAKRVTNVPAVLFGSGEGESNAGIPGGARAQPLDTNRPTSNQSHYDMALAVHPDHPEILVLGGSAVEVSNASLFKCTVQDPGGSPHLDYQPANDPKPATPKGTAGSDPTFIGRGVHADVHGVTFSKRGAVVDVWVGCDGGIYRSTSGGANHTWQTRNNGLGVLEPGYLACHPTHESVVVVGTQDNGVLRRTGDTTWTWELAGDGGGVAIHPTKPHLYMAESTASDWRTSEDRDMQPVQRHWPLLDHETKEDEATNFYSAPGMVAATNAEGARVAIGTNRVWVSEDFGATWYTVKAGTDPRKPPRNDTGQDVKYHDYRDTVLVCRWLNENELYVLCDRSIQRFTRNPGPVTWDRAVVTDHKNKCFAYKESDITGAKMEHLPPLGEWSDLAFHLPGPNGSTTLYVACTSRTSTPKMDTLWWFDGVKTWYATGLRAAVKAPALAVVVDPTDSNTVYVGTTVGVYRGTFSRALGGEPAWVWTDFVAGLPEAAVQDLSIFHDAAEPLLLLRAALQSRGVWEVDLQAPCDEKTYLRVHGFDSRRRAVTTLVDPTKAPAASAARPVHQPGHPRAPAPTGQRGGHARVAARAADQRREPERQRLPLDVPDRVPPARRDLPSHRPLVGRVRGPARGLQDGQRARRRSRDRRPDVDQRGHPGPRVVTAVGRPVTDRGRSAAADHGRRRQGAGHPVRQAAPGGRRAGAPPGAPADPAAGRVGAAAHPAHDRARGRLADAAHQRGVEDPDGERPHRRRHPGQRSVARRWRLGDRRHHPGPPSRRQPRRLAAPGRVVRGDLPEQHHQRALPAARRLLLGHRHGHGRPVARRHARRPAGREPARRRPPTAHPHLRPKGTRPR